MTTSAAPSQSESERLARLITQRDRLDVAIESCDSMRDLAALSREYRAVMAEIATLVPPEQKGDAVDEIAQRRAARRSGAAKGSGSAKRSS